MGMNGKKVAVLMSTYNGARFAENQIESILNQSLVSLHLFIRDDGSKDETMAVLNKYRNYENVTIVDATENVGYKNSFLTLLDVALHKTDKQFKYFSFADQDDVWRPDKLVRAVEKLEHHFDSKYRLYYSGMTVTDSNLNTLLEKRYCLKNTLEESLVRFSLTGTTMVFSRVLAEKLLVSDEIYDLKDGHDTLLFRLNLALCGVVIYDDYSGVLFRRHDANASTGGKNIMAKIKDDFAKKYYKATSDQAKFILKHYEDDMTVANINIMNKVANYGRPLNMISIFFNQKMKRESFIMNVVFRAKLISGFL